MPDIFSAILTNGNKGVRLLLIADEYEDSLDFHLTEGLGNFSTVRIFINDDDEAMVKVQKFAPDQEDYDTPNQSMEFFLFRVRTLDGRKS